MHACFVSHLLVGGELCEHGIHDGWLWNRLSCLEQVKYIVSLHGRGTSSNDQKVDEDDLNNNVVTRRWWCSGGGAPANDSFFRLAAPSRPWSASLEFRLRLLSRTFSVKDQLELASLVVFSLPTRTPFPSLHPTEQLGFCPLS